MTNQELKKIFLLYLITERHYSELTKKAYEEDINEFTDFLSATGEPSYKSVSLQDVRIFLGELSERELSRNTISRKISSLRAFYQFLLKNEVVTENPFSYIHLKTLYKASYHY